MNAYYKLQPSFHPNQHSKPLHKNLDTNQWYDIMTSTPEPDKNPQAIHQSNKTLNYHVSSRKAIIEVSYE
jgi:hypothetical protein